MNKRTAYLLVALIVPIAGGLEARALRRASPSASHSVTSSDTPLTTSGVIAMKNLDSDLLDAESQVRETNGQNVRVLLRRANLVQVRARVTGDIDEMARALALTDAAIEAHPSSYDAHLLRAGQLQTLHRFKEAREALDRALLLGANPEKVAGLIRELDWSQGQARAVAKAIRDDAKRRPSLASLGRAARLAHDLGSFDEADALYRAALERVKVEPNAHDPIPVAMMEVQRGMNLVDASRLEDAAEVFRSATRRLPAYTAAREHLAETLHRLGRDDEAIALYEQITKVSTDPEFIGALAALYRQRGRHQEADALRAKATARYDELLARYPEAMAWHAAEYFAGEGADVERARALLRQNVELRPNAESLSALARVERELGDSRAADELERRAAAIRTSALTM